jgi:DNA polymerase III alpha subunit
MKIIREITIEELKKNLYNLDLSDKNIYIEANNPNTVGTFQLDSSTSSRVLEKVVPQNFEEIVAISSLARPGTIDFTDEYVDNKNTGNRKYPEKVNEILSDSHGVMLFQEHTLKIFNQIGGFTLIEADSVRNLMKKLGKADKKKEDVEKWDKTIERFKEGAEKNGISKEDAVLVANDLLKMSGYSFNKCFSGDCVITSPNGNFRIEDLYCIGKKLKNINSYSLDMKGDYVENNIIAIYWQGKRIVYEIIIDDGNKLKVTSNHKFPVIKNNEYIETCIDDGLSVGDFIFSLSNKTCVSQKIISIILIGEEFVYDVEMRAPYHTLCVNNIFASNSHAVAYTYISALTLYLSFYFRKFFYSAVLSYEVDRKKYLINKMMSIKKQGFKILKPDINKSKLKIAPVSETEIVYGLLDIKNLGKSVEQIIENRPYNSFRDFVISSLATEGNKVNSRAIESLLKAGAFDCFDENTTLLLAIFKSFWEKKKSVKLRERLEIIYDEIEKTISSFNFETTIQDHIDMEKEIYGHNFFTSRFMEDKLAAILAEGLAKRKIVISFDDIEEEMSERVPVFVSNMRFHIDKKGGKMAFIEVEDPTGDSVEIPLFASVWKHIEDKIEIGNIYMMVLNKNSENKIMFGRGGWEIKAEVLRSWIKKYSG